MTVEASGEGAAPPPPPAPRAAGLPEELWALGCYVPLCGAGAFVSVVALAIVGRRRPRLRFHAWQGLMLSVLAPLLAVGPWLAGHALETAGLPPFGVALVLLQLASASALLAGSLWLMVAAYHRRDVALPLVGALARRWSGFAGS